MKPEFLDYILDSKLFVTVCLVTAIMLLRGLLTLAIARSSWQKADKRRRINTVHNIGNLLLVVGLMVIWVSELRDFALSIAAFSVAIVLALREAVQCLVGGLYQANMRSFTVGDWIKVGDQFGEVTDSDWLSTTLLEIDPHGLGNGYTGTTLYIPNNAFFTQPVKNLNFMRRYIEHTFSITRERSEINPFEAKKFIAERLKEHCDSFREVAERYCKLIESRMGVELSGPDAKVSVATNDLGHDVITATIFCPREEATNIEQLVTEDFYNFWFEKTKNLKAGN
ncbi:mechanosensitive ion channel family protein [Microbulbifer sp. ANSA001]|uniref:mechanosensitive ion channel family protein n=1 Tax=Microbulbifer sp. ANSA001 TaxID=3243358 RepID=UPI0040414054